MPKIVRGLEDCCVYHVLNRGNGRREVFYNSILNVRCPSYVQNVIRAIKED